MSGPLAGITVIELGGIGPVPFAGMMLADFGADVIRIDRPGSGGAAGRAAHHAVLDRGRRSTTVDLTDPAGVQTVLDLCARADVLIEGFRPGVTERLGLGPEPVHATNPRLVYGRGTGWGQTGPYAGRAGHDIDYLAVSGALEPIVGADGAPTPPLNLLGDFGAGGLLLAYGVLAAVLHARATGEGQVVDAAIVDGVALFTAMHQAMLASGLHTDDRGENLLDGGAPFYRTYRTADDHWLAVGAIEPAFWADLLTGLGLHDRSDLGDQHDRSHWPQQRMIIAETIARRTRAEWVTVFADLDACVAPVLSPAEAAVDPHLVHRGVWSDRDGVRHPAPAPRISSAQGD